MIRSSSSVGIAAERLVGGLHPQHVAVVVGPPHVDLPLEAALALVLVVGDVRGEVGVLAGGAHEHAVLVVAVLGRAQPQRTLAAVGAALLLEDRERVRHRARIALVQRALIRPAVEAHAERGQRAPDLPTITATAARPSSAGSSSRGVREARRQGAAT